MIIEVPYSIAVDSGSYVSSTSCDRSSTEALGVDLGVVYGYGDAIIEDKFMLRYHIVL